MSSKFSIATAGQNKGFFSNRVLFPN
uniref:Uncharacterized protein n=1 Tax=Rhizophora mucronata TaxID=61149 RepID=A0A2P2N400_RHIMU